MTPVSGTSVDLEQARLEIRAQAARKRLHAEALQELPGATGSTFNWLQVRSVLQKTAQLPALDALPDVDRYHGIKRRLARWLARGMLFVARFVLDRQASWNRQLLGVLREMGKALHHAEMRAAQQEERIRRLEAQLRQAINGGRMKEEG